MQKLRIKREIDGEVVSSLWLYHVDLPSRKLSVIEEVWTHPDYRRRGYAREIVTSAISEARRQGSDCVELTVREDRPDLQAFYASLGFVDRMNRAMRLRL